MAGWCPGGCENDRNERDGERKCRTNENGWLLLGKLRNVTAMKKKNKNKCPVLTGLRHSISAWNINWVCNYK